MKFFPFILGCALLISSAIAPAQDNPAAKAERYYRQGLTAEGQGNAGLARRSFQSALRLNPNHANARYHLLQLSGADARLSAKARQLKLGRTILPKVELDGASFQEVLDMLDALVRKETKNQFVPNFVIQDPSGKLAERTVDIRLRNVPATAVLKYAAEQVGAKIRYDAHAVLIRPVKPIKTDSPEPAE
jgi:hypothetical protein